MNGFLGVFKIADSSDDEWGRVTGKYVHPQRANSFISDQLFFHNSYQVSSTFVSDKFPYLYYTGWCRLDNLKVLYTELGLSEGTQESDIILSAYQRWGNNCVKHFIGDFSFVIWNNKEKRLFLAKDQIGIRPLFYMLQDGLLYFSTSIPLIKEMLPAKPELNSIYIAKELKNFPQEVEDTFFKNIKRLKPAHFIDIAHSEEIIEHRYWDLQFINLRKCKSDQDYYDLLNDAIKEAILCRIRGKKIIGCQLSGGMDSSFLAFLLSKLTDKNNLHTYSFVLDDITRPFSDGGIDEQETQDEVIAFANLTRENHHKITGFHYKDVYEELHVQNMVMGGIANSDCIWQDSMYKVAGEQHNVSVMFSGFPGDEGISNPGNKFFHDYLYHWDILGLLSYLIEFKINGLRTIVKYFRMKRAGTFSLNYNNIQNERDLLNPVSELNQMLNDTSFSFIPGFKMWLKSQMCREHASLRTESEGAYANRHGIETVYPLTDIRVLEIVYSLPLHLFKPKPYSRALFRNLTKGMLPERVRLQPKFSGAKTLAFADYWRKNKIEQLESYQIKNHTGLMISEEELLKKPLSDDQSNKNRFSKLKQMDYLIGLNWTE